MLFGQDKCYDGHGFEYISTKMIILSQIILPIWTQSTEKDPENILAIKLTQTDYLLSDEVFGQKVFRISLDR